MPLWLDDLLADPALGLQLVAGSAGLRRRGPIRWVHISEIPDPTPWLEGGELLLTTGLAIKDSPDLQRKLVAGLDHRGCAGIGFGVGIWVDDLPPAMRDEAEARELPLFTVPYAVPFIAVTKLVSRRIFDEHYATLRGAVELHRQVLASVLSGRGIAGVLRTFLRGMPEVTGAVFDYYGNLLARHPVGAELDAVDLWRALTTQRNGHDRVELSWRDRTVTAVVIRLGEHVEAILALVSEHPLLEHEELLLQQGLTGISLELARGLSTRETRRARVAELLDEAEEGTTSDRSLSRRLERLGLASPDGFETVCVLGAGSVSERALCTVIEDAIAATGLLPIVASRGDAAYCVLPAGAEPAVRAIADGVVTRFGRGVTVGRSRVQHDRGQVALSLREAHFAATASNAEDTVRDVTSLGLPGVLAGVSEALVAAAFVAQTLGPVIDYDEQEGTELVASLAAFLQHGCRSGPAAEELCVHRHTLSYRLDRIHQLTGRDPRDGAHLLEFGLALELHERRRNRAP